MKNLFEKVNLKTVLSIAGGIAAIAGMAISAKTEAIDRDNMKEEIRNEIMENLNLNEKD